MFTSGWSWMMLVLCQFDSQVEPPLQFQSPSQSAPPTVRSEFEPARSRGFDEVEDAPGSFGAEPAAQPLSNVDRAQKSLSDQLYRALSAVAAASPEGRPVSLLEALSSATGRDRREVVRAYWQLACSMLDFQFRSEEAQMLEQAAEAVGGAGTAELRAGLAAATARRTEAQVRVIEAQQQLATMLQPALGGQLPWAGDAPHAGPYRTRFDELFVGRPAPPQAALLHRILPLRHQEVAARAEAAQAASQAASQSLQAFTTGRLEPLQFVSDVSLLASVRRTLIDSLRQYNSEIADYALGVTAAPQVQTVAAMLIKPRTAQFIPPTATSGGGDAVQRTQFEQQQPSAPTPPQLPAGGAAGFDAQPEPAPADGAALSAEETAQLLADTRVYQGLVGVEPNKQTQRLINSLYRLEAEQRPSGNRLQLAEILQATANNRPVARDMVEGYWRAAEYAARRLVLDDVAVQLEALKPVAAEAAQSSGAIEPALLRAAERAARADYLATDIALLAEQHRLLSALGRPLDQAWAMPVTVPHGGRYLTKSAADSSNPPGQIEQLHSLLVAESDAVVELDQVRSDAVAHYTEGRNDLRVALSAIAQQTDATLSLLSNVTRYNQQIAAYALSVLPANATPAVVESALVAHSAPPSDG